MFGLPVVGGIGSLRPQHAGLCACMVEGDAGQLTISVLFIVPHSLLLICYVNMGNGKFNKNTDGITTTMGNHFKLRHSNVYESDNK